MPMGDIIRRSAKRSPKKTALIFGNESLIYEELNARVNRLAGSLLRMGLKKGDRIAVLLHNGLEFFEIYYASAKIGGIFVPINNLLKKNELRQIFDYVEPRILFFDPDYTEIILSMGTDLKPARHLVSVRGSAWSGVDEYRELIDRGKAEEPNLTISDDDIVSIFLTSGTTGLPKGAMRTHRHAYVDALVGAIELNLRHDDRMLMVFPFYHVTWEDNMRHILMGNSIVIRKEGRFDTREVLDVLSREKVTICQFVPTMISAMLQGEDLEKVDLSHFRLLTYAASPMPVELLKKAMKRFQCQFMQLYGQTETGPLTTVLRPKDHVIDGSQEQVARLASAGRPVLNYEVRIVDGFGRDVRVGEIGEIIVRSESMTVGYWKMPHETAETIKDGWLHTGDFGRFDDDGYVY
ncbi:MAG: AMP-binding protein, partial [Desulfobacterales bacterium]|nr:AMP-binding protein [Desulfobacterales bacterium]